MLPIRSSSPAEAEPYPAQGYAWYVVGVLTLAYIFSFIDRQILSLMVGPIQKDLGIDDIQMSLLMGLSFAVFYTLFGIPLGRLADTRSRRAIISVGIAVWSVMTAGCGLARTFWQLAIMRMGVGVGEASLSPSAYSLISDYFRPERRSTAMSVYSMGIYIGSGLAFILGGFIMQLASGTESTVLPLDRSGAFVAARLFRRGVAGALDIALAPHGARAGSQGRPLESRRFGDHGADVAGGMVVYPDELRDIPLPHPGHGPGRPVRLWGLCLDTGHVDPPLWLVAGNKRAWFSGSIVAVAGTLGIVSGGRLADWLRQRGYADSDLRVALWGTIAGLPFVCFFRWPRRQTWPPGCWCPSCFS